MCGIVGIFNFKDEAVSTEVLRSMMTAVKHRGPDGEGLYTERFLGLGHRRLAIIDLSEAGQQPMKSQDGSHVIVYNGEIYNYREMRKELEAKGFPFSSQSDTEVLLNAYKAWGTKVLEKANG